MLVVLVAPALRRVLKLALLTRPGIPPIRFVTGVLATVAELAEVAAADAVASSAYVRGASEAAAVFVARGGGVVTTAGDCRRCGSALPAASRPRVRRSRRARDPSLNRSPTDLACSLCTPLCKSCAAWYLQHMCPAHSMADGCHSRGRRGSACAVPSSWRVRGLSLREQRVLFFLLFEQHVLVAVAQINLRPAQHYRNHNQVDCMGQCHVVHGQHGVETLNKLYIGRLVRRGTWTRPLGTSVTAVVDEPSHTLLAWYNPHRQGALGPGCP